MNNSNKDNTNNKGDNEIQLSPISDLIDLTDRSLDRMFKGATQIYNDYSDLWSESVDDTLSTATPSVFWGRSWTTSSPLEDSYDGSDRFQRWGHSPWSYCGRRGRDAAFGADQSTFQIEGTKRNDLFLSSSENSNLSNNEIIDLDPSKPKNLWAFPVPSSKQYEQCKKLEGTSVWTREGVWRCLFPSSSLDKSRLDSALKKSTQLSSSSKFDSPTNELAINSVHAFPDFTSYLDWKSQIRKAIQVKEERELAEWQDNFNRQLSVTRGSEERQHPAFISEEEAIKQNKNVVSSSVSSSTITKGDGTLETRKIVKKCYSDGTASVTENVSTSNDQNSRNDSSSGWFWK